MSVYGIAQLVSQSVAKTVIHVLSGFQGVEGILLPITEPSDFLHNSLIFYHPLSNGVSLVRKYYLYTVSDNQSYRMDIGQLFLLYQNDKS